MLDGAHGRGGRFRRWQSRVGSCEVELRWLCERAVAIEVNRKHNDIVALSSGLQHITICEAIAPARDIVAPCETCAGAAAAADIVSATAIKNSPDERNEFTMTMPSPETVG